MWIWSLLLSDGGHISLEATPLSWVHLPWLGYGQTISNHLSSPQHQAFVRPLLGLFRLAVLPTLSSFILLPLIYSVQGLLWKEKFLTLL